MENHLYKIREHGKYGFMNQAGQVVIEPQYYEAENFYNGFSRVRFNNKLVPLDSLGRLLMKHLFNFVGNFEEELAMAADDTQIDDLIERLNLIMAAGQIRENTKDKILNAVKQVPASQNLDRLQMAMFLIMYSPDYLIFK